MKKIIALSVMFTILSGCATVGRFPKIVNEHTVELSHNNYRVIETAVSGEDDGFLLFGIIPFKTPSYSIAMTRLHEKIKIKNKSAVLINVIREYTWQFAIIGLYVKGIITADVIEFIDEENKE